MVTQIQTQTLPVESMLLGEILVRAGLISQAQVDFALYEQQCYGEQALGQQYRLGDILVLRGWLAQKTADFFAVRWPLILLEGSRHRLGEYLEEAGLLTPEQQETLVREQGFNRMRLGTLAVLKGWLQQQTLDFFLTYLYPEEKRQGHWLKAQTAKKPQHNDPQATQIQAETQISPTSTSSEFQLWFEQDDQVPWFD